MLSKPRYFRELYYLFKEENTFTILASIRVFYLWKLGGGGGEGKVGSWCRNESFKGLSNAWSKYMFPPSPFIFFFLSLWRSCQFFFFLNFRPVCFWISGWWWTRTIPDSGEDSDENRPSSEKGIFWWGNILRRWFRSPAATMSVITWWTRGG